jgi:hypothetical protein
MKNYSLHEDPINAINAFTFTLYRLGIIDYQQGDLHVKLHFLCERYYD